VELLDAVNTDLAKYVAAMDAVQLKAGLKLAMGISQHGNVYVQRTEPWRLVKTDTERAKQVVSLAAHVVRLVASLLEPFLGSAFSAKIYRMLGIADLADVNAIGSELKFDLPIGGPTGKPELLFTTIDDATVAALRAQFSGTQSTSASIHATTGAASGASSASASAPQPSEDALPLDLRVGRLVKVEESADSETLYVGEVDVGEAEGPRALVAGLRGLYSREELLGRLVVVVCNLQPANFAGIVSRGMLLTAEKKKDVKLLGFGGDSQPEPGHRIVLAQHAAHGNSGSDANFVQLDRKGFQNASKQFRVGENGTIVFDKKHALVVSPNAEPVLSGGIASGGKLK